MIWKNPKVGRFSGTQCNQKVRGTHIRQHDLLVLEINCGVKFMLLRICSVTYYFLERSKILSEHPLSQNFMQFAQYSITVFRLMEF